VGRPRDDEVAVHGRLSRLIRQPEQIPREPAADVEKSHRLDDLVGFAQPARERLEDPPREREIAGEHGEEIGLTQGRELAVGEGRDGGAAALPFEQSHLAEEVSRLQVRQDDLPSVGRVDEDLDLSAKDHEEQVSGLGLAKDRCARGERPWGERPCERVHLSRLQLREERRAAQDGSINHVSWPPRPG
jgi:hypothetical protein